MPRKKDAKKEPVLPINQLLPPPMQQEPEMLFTEQPDVDRLEQQLSGSGWNLPGNLRGARPRIGRGGRLIFDRWDSLPDRGLRFK
jgi:hypothetical protein